MKFYNLTELIDVNQGIKKFTHRHTCNNILIGGAIEILHAPLSGWKTITVKVELACNDDFLLHPQAIHLLTPYKQKLIGQGYETKYRIVVLEQLQDKPCILRVVFAPTTYEESSGFHQGLLEAAKNGDDSILTLQQQWASQLIQPGTYCLPGVATVHVIVTTSDKQIVLCKRSPNVNYHPSHWSISFEEQMNQEDLRFGHTSLFAAAARGFHEELVPDHDEKPENMSILGVFLEYEILNIGFCIHIETPLRFDEIKFNWKTRARDKWEAIDVAGDPFTIENVARLLKSNSYGNTKEAIDAFHPTSKYRLLLVALKHFGSDAVIDALK